MYSAASACGPRMPKYHSPAAPSSNRVVFPRQGKRSKFPSGVVGASQVTLSVWDASGGLWKRSVGLSS